jgi:tagatose 6-phosphate kinase
MILCLGPTPALQRVMRFKRLTLDAVNRAAVTLDGIAGKAVNVAKVLQALGEEPLLTGFAGGERGSVLCAALDQCGIMHEFVTVAAPTRQCVTVIDEVAGTHTELVEESRAVEPADYERLLAIVRHRVAGCRALVMSGTLTPDGPVDFYAQCVRLVQAERIITVVDAQGPALLAALPAKPGLVKPNRAELGTALGRQMNTDADVLAGLRELCERGASIALATAGRLPTLVFDGQRAWRIVSPTVQAVNPIGSGDAFTAALVWRLLRGDDLGEACRWGAAAGAANALTPRAGEVNREDLERLARAVEVEEVKG